MAVISLFYLFALCLIVSACVVICASNTVHKALALIVAFFNAGMLMLLGGAEFISFVVMIVYVGAVAVLFLFVVMMLNLTSDTLRKQYGPYLSLVLCVAALLLLEVGGLIYFFESHGHAVDLLVSPRPSRTENIVALGQILYTHYAYIFQVTGLILFVAMIGAIVLTEGFRRVIPYRSQDAATQLKRHKAHSLVLTTPGVREGVSIDMAHTYYRKKEDGSCV